MIASLALRLTKTNHSEAPVLEHKKGEFKLDFVFQNGHAFNVEAVCGVLMLGVAPREHSGARWERLQHQLEPNGNRSWRT